MQKSKFLLNPFHNGINIIIMSTVLNQTPENIIVSMNFDTICELRGNLQKQHTKKAVKVGLNGR